MADFEYVKYKDFTGSQKNSNNSITYTYIIRVYELSYDSATNKHRVRYEAILKQDSTADGFLIWATGVQVTRNGMDVINSYEQRDCSGTKEHLYDYFEEELEGNEGILVASRIADRVGITRSVIVNALRKFESAGVIESRSSGMKGTYIKVVNDVVFDELHKIKKGK